MPESKYKMPRKLRDAWIADLLSGEFKQGEGALHNESDEYCCLGVLVCTAQKLGYPISLAPLNAEHQVAMAGDALVWNGKTEGAAGYDPLQEHLFIDGMKYEGLSIACSAFFAPFVRRNDGYIGFTHTPNPEPPIRKHSFPEMADFILWNVKAVD